LSAAQTVTGSITENTVQKWWRAWHNGEITDSIDQFVSNDQLPVR